MMLMKNGRYLIKKFNEKKVGKCIFPIVLLIGLLFNSGSYYGGNVYMKLNSVTVELGDKLPDEIIGQMNILTSNSDLEFENNVPKDENGNTTKIGEFSYYLVYNDSNYKVSKLTNVRSTINVVDTISPVITIKDDYKFKYASEIKASDVALCKDLSGCEMYFKEDIDTRKSGEHEVTVVAVDGGNNESYVTTMIEILEKPKPKITFSNYSSSFSNMNIHNNNLNSKLSDSDKSNLRYQVVNFAKQFVGNPYVYGGNSLTHGTDCSGFTMGVYGNFGYQLPRSSVSQIYLGIEVSPYELLPGDLVVYYYGHVGIYAGNGMMVHAATSDKGIVYAPVFGGNKTYRRIIF